VRFLPFAEAFFFPPGRFSQSSTVLLPLAASGCCSIEVFFLALLFSVGVPLYHRASFERVTSVPARLPVPLSFPGVFGGEILQMFFPVGDFQVGSRSDFDG